jgi:hypothetical protein
MQAAAPRIKHEMMEAGEMRIDVSSVYVPFMIYGDGRPPFHLLAPGTEVLSLWRLVADQFRAD